MKTVLTWDDPEVRSGPDLQQDYVKFVLHFLKNVVQIKPQFVTFHQKINLIENNGVYVGCTICNVPKFKSGHARKLSGTWEDLCAFNYNEVIIHPGTFSFLMQKADLSQTFFSVYKDQNSIAIQDVFSPLIRLKGDLNKDKDRLESLLKIMFNSSKKSFKDYEASKVSIETILKELEKVKIGTDPEFSVVQKSNKDSMVNAFNVLKASEFRIGTDGHNSILELRPTASNDLEVFCKELDDIVAETSEIVDDDEYELLTGGGLFRGEPLGGHIHFSNIAPSPDFLKLLDVYIGNPLKACTGGKRPEGGDQYGKESDFRNQSYDDGKVQGFEYRTPPCFWTNEKLTKATYIISMLLAKTYLIYKKQRKPFEYETICNIENYKKLHDYEKYKSFIDYFFEFVSKKTSINGYLFANWEIKRKKEKETVLIQIAHTDDQLLGDIIPDSVNVYKPPFRAVTFYGLSEKSSTLAAVNIDSYFINGNVHTGFLHRWMRDFIRDICIVDRNIKQDNINDFLKNGRLWIGLSMPLRQLTMKMDPEIRKKFFKSFLKRLSVFIRDSVKNPIMLDENDENEMKEFKKIKELII